MLSEQKALHLTLERKSACQRLLHLIDVGVPHLGEETEGRRRVWVVYRKLDPSLEVTVMLYIYT